MSENLFDSGERRQYRDRRIPPSLLPILAAVKVRTIPEPFSVVAFAPADETAIRKAYAKLKKLPFSSYTQDDRGTTVVLPSEAWRKIADQFPEAKVDRGFRILAIEGDADWTTPGFLPVIGRALAEGNIAAGYLTGYRRLHLLIPARQLKDARVFFDLLATQARGRMQRTRNQTA